MNFFNFELKKIIIIAVLVSIPLFSVNMQQKSGDRPWILEPFYFASSAIQNSYASFSSGVRSTTDLYLNLIDIKKENRVLSNEIAELKAQLGALTELKLENERLNRLLDFKQKSNMQLLTAKIIGRDLLVDSQSATIDRGEDHGVKKGMGVITVSGVVGYVIEVEKQTSKILILTDLYSVIDSIVQRSRARGIVQGLGRNTCSLSFLKRSDDVVEGDVIVTSGLDNYFPKGFPVGTVTKVEKDDYGLSQDITLQPIVNSANIEEVFVVINAKNQDLENLSMGEANAPIEAKGN